ncbi:helix-turn-helix transcriptional regulator [Anaerotignum propionicum]|uniref:helix-turn-helix domain-containing protein n=1 Tax=Anaerotignum propionicum TaxID=28446 RepID=UPI002897816F|nr:helix-turn-helix transcriptional regulator [Anaerotignum propionicum]
MKINEILREERKKRNMTQKQVAEYLHMAQASYALYETGKNIPTTESIIKLADLYKVSTDYLLGRYS